MNVFKELNTNPSQRDRIQLGLVILVATAVLGALMRFRWARPDAAPLLWGVGAAVMILSLIPPIGRVLYIAWMGFGMLLGLVTSPIIMGGVYLTVIVPVGLVFKLMRRDTMRRSLDPAAKSYWEDYPEADDPRRYVRQF